MKIKKAKRLAKKIIAKMFVDGSGVQYDRVVLVASGASEHGTGWGKGPIFDMLFNALTEKRNKAKG